jgi:hypothetical protein
MFSFFKGKEKNAQDVQDTLKVLGLDPSLFADATETEFSSSLPTEAHENVNEAELLKELEKLHITKESSQKTQLEVADTKNRLEPQVHSLLHGSETMISSNHLLGEVAEQPTITMKQIYELLQESPMEDEQEEAFDEDLNKDSELLKQLEVIRQANNHEAMDHIESDIPIPSSVIPSCDIERDTVKPHVSTTSDLLISQISTTEASSEIQIDKVSDHQDIASVTPSVVAHDVLQQFMTRRREYLEVALNYKRSGQLNEAKHFYSISKSLDVSIQQLQSGEQVSLEQLPPKPHDIYQKKQTTEAVIGVALSRHVDDVLHSPLETSSTMSFERIESLLKVQISECDQLCRYHLLENCREEALKFRKLGEFLKQDIDIVIQAKSKQTGVPRFTYRPIHLSYKKVITDISANELEIQVIQAIGLHATKETGPLNTFITCEFPYPGDAGIKFDSAVVTSADPIYNVVKRLSIERNRNFQRVLERKKLIVTLFNSNRLFSLIPIGTTFYGRAFISLEPLFTQCDIHEFAEVSAWAS